MARRTKAEAEATREAILDAAEEVFIENGVSRATLEQIARRAGVTRGAVYWHFKDKNDLFTAMINRVRLPMRTLAESLRSTSRGDILQILHDICRHAVASLHDNPRERRVYTILFSRCEFVSETNPIMQWQRELDHEAISALTADMQLAADGGLLREGLQPRVAALSLHTFIKGLYLEWLCNPKLFDLRTEGLAMLDEFFAGLRREPAAATRNDGSASLQETPAVDVRVRSR